MLGTERGPVDPAPVPGAAAPVLETVWSRQASTEERVLWAAAVLGPYEDAGETSGAVAPDGLLEPAPADERPRCSDDVAQILRRILAEQPALLAEWLELAATAGVIAPPSALPDLLDAGKRSKEIRPQLVKVVGRRGRWLAELNPPWSYLEKASAGDNLTEPDAAQLDQEAWDEGTLAERETFLRDLRRVDPASALELLKEVWTSENAATRERLLGTLDEGLGMSDEPFLEEALGDRSKRVRGVAAELLGRLPASRRARRMIARAEAIFRLERKMLRKSLVVQEPDEWDAAAQADGLTEGAARDLGPAAWRIRELAAATPVSFWTDDLGLSCEELARQVDRSPWKQALSSGLARAAQLQENVDLARALVQAFRDDDSRAREERVVAPLLPQDEYDALAVGRVAKAESLAELSTLVASHVSGASCYWSAELSRAVHVKARQHTLSPETGDAWRLSQLLPSIGIRLHPDVIEEARKLWPEDLATTHRIQEEVDKFQIVLVLRHQMREVFRT